MVERGTVIDGRYEVVSRIGSGGMADVYCAEDRQLGRRVALKVLHERFAEDQEFVERFRREASSAAGLSHPNVVNVYDRGQWDGTYYIAMEYLEGRSLKTIVREQGQLDPAAAIDIAIQILRAARFAHRRGVIHRDLKPHNVILDEDGRVKVTDFGIARAGASDMTQTGSIMGTAQYLSPEQAQGHAVSASSDLYSVGVLLYELLTGRVPFDGDSPVTIALKQISTPPDPPSRLNPAVTPALDAVVLCALAKDPAQRFVDADQFIAALEEARATLGVPASATTAFAPSVAPAPPTGPHPAVELVPYAAEPPVLADYYTPPPDHRERRRWWLLALLLALLIAGGAVAAVLLTNKQQVVVPSVVGRSQTVAVQRVAAAGFKANVFPPVVSSARADQVIAESPRGGSKAAKGSTVNLTVSAGPGSAGIPNVGGIPARQAKQLLQQSGFKVVQVPRPDATAPAGTAIGTRPPGGSQAQAGSSIVLFVSSGPQLVRVPGVVGDQVGAAQTLLTSLGLKVKSVQQATSSARPGTVTAQAPQQGTQEPKGSIVTLTVAKAPPTVAVPNVVGQPQAQAIAMLRAAGLTAQFSQQPVQDPAQNGVVLSQQPPAGRKVKPASVVALVLGSLTAPPTGASGGGTGATG